MIKICKKCKSEFEVTKGLVNYCSLHCRNSKNHSVETKEKIKNSILKRIQLNGKSLSVVPHETRVEVGKLLKQRSLDKIVATPFEELSYERLKKRIAYEQNNKCLHCKLDSWNNKPLVLELDHIDGNNKNNVRENLRCLCPNCHSQTDTWRGKNKTVKPRISNDVLYNVLIDYDWNIRKSLMHLNLAAKGGNYKRCYMLKKLHLESHKMVDVNG